MAKNRNEISVIENPVNGDPVNDETVNHVYDGALVPSDDGTFTSPDPDTHTPHLTIKSQESLGSTDEDKETIKGVSYRMTADADVRWVNWDKVFADRNFNVREARAYTPDDLAGLRANMEAEGLKEALEVSLQADGLYKITKGHRRHAVFAYQRADFAKLVDAGTEPASKMPWRKVPVKILKGLTLEEEISEMLDHGQRKSLNTVELAKAVQILVNLGWSDKRIENKLEQTRGNIAVHLKAARLPKEVQEEYKRYLRKEEGALPLTADNVGEMSKAFNADKAKGQVDFGGGPEFRAVWSKVKDHSATFGRNKTKSVKTRTENERDLSVSLHPYLTTYLNALLGAKDTTDTVMRDMRDNISVALNKSFPINQIIKTEGNVTTVLGATVTDDDDDRS